MGCSLLDDAPTPFSAATPLSRFRRDDVIAAGDVATTYRAYDSLTGQPVTLIEFHPDQIVDPSIELSFSARFGRESKVLAAINHPNVIRVVAWGNEFGRPFLAIESVSGRTLAEVIRDRGALPPGNAATIIRQILAGLGAIHAAGLLHLKLTSRAVLLGDDGIVRITEVGLTAPNALSFASDAPSKLDTERYQAPELLSGLDVSEATDLYAVGAITYETLTGQAPFPGANPVLVRFAQMQAAAPIPSRLVTRGIPPALDQFVVRALAKQPVDRYVDSRAMLDALDDVAWQIEATPITAPQPQPSSVPAYYDDGYSPRQMPPPVKHQIPVRSVDLVRPPRVHRARSTNSGWVVPMVIAGLVIAVLIVGLVRNLTSEQPMEAVAGVSVLETTSPSPTASTTASPTARVVNAARDEDANPTKKSGEGRKATATKTPKPTRTPKSDSDD
jgi:serine/threonine protein kinase